MRELFCFKLGLQGFGSFFEGGPVSSCLVVTFSLDVTQADRLVASAVLIAVGLFQGVPPCFGAHNLPQEDEAPSVQI